MSDDGDAETLDDLPFDAQKHGVPISWAWLDDILHVKEEVNITEEMLRANLTREIPNVHERTTADENIKCGDNEALPGLQAKLESLTLDHSVSYNRENRKEECNKASYNC